MRIAIISDIHANLEALAKTFEVIDSKMADQVVCLGDLVGYGANPSECLSLVRQKTSFVLLGNHDQATIDLTATETFNPHARAAVQWTHDELTLEDKEFLRQLPYTLELQNLLFVHSSPYQPEEWHYIITAADARDNFAYFEEPVCFIGHTHVPGVFVDDVWSRPPKGSSLIELDRRKKYIVNVGSVGQPRDGDWRLSFGIFDTDTWTYQHVRAEYDVQSASEKILDAGLPRMLAQRILVGM